MYISLDSINKIGYIFSGRQVKEKYVGGTYISGPKHRTRLAPCHLTDITRPYGVFHCNAPPPFGQAMY